MQPTHSNRRQRPRGPWGHAVSRVLRARARRANDQRGYRELLSLDDRILKDIGITRDMVRHQIHRTNRWFV